MRRRPPILGKYTKVSLLILIVGTIGFGIYLFFLPSGGPENLEVHALNPRIETPEEVRGIYITSFIAAEPERRKLVIDMVENTTLNTVVIDIKDSEGRFTFRPKRENLAKIKPSPVTIHDLEAWLQDLHKKGIYTIARMTTFQDSAAVQEHPEWGIRSTDGGVWRDWQGNAWIDPGCEEAWEYISDTAREAYDIGFDEVNFDYIRFPSDGPVSKMVFYYHQDDIYRKFQTMGNFFSWLDSSLNYLPMPISIDLFGLTYFNQNPNDDMNIGQRVIDTIDHFDYVMPMVYASHYVSGFLGFINPAEHPYEVVSESLLVGNEIIEDAGGDHRITRPWIQDFDMGAEYTAEMVKAQIQAAREQGASGWIAWNAKNEYTAEAFK